KIIVKLILVSLLLVQLGMEADATVMMLENDTVPVTRDDYMRLSKSQNTAAIIMVSVGGSAFLVGVIGGWGVAANNYDAAWVGGEQKNSSGYIIAAVGGGILALASIPVFRAATKNRKNARMAPQVKLKMENTRQIVFSDLNTTCFPSVALKLRF
ncbi:MAG TPA: hypothetical protein VFV68_16235, partial [Agriterribacter sp.]|nr:hypothetical protein [Agriterribacter sp.]